jgi:hypothetical protein
MLLAVVFAEAIVPTTREIAAAMAMGKGRQVVWALVTVELWKFMSFVYVLLKGLSRFNIQYRVPLRRVNIEIY